MSEKQKSDSKILLISSRIQWIYKIEKFEIHKTHLLIIIYDYIIQVL